MIVLAMSLLLAQPGVETPSMAVMLTSIPSPEGAGDSIVIRPGAFRGLPKPGPGILFTATRLPSANPSILRVQVEARSAGRLVASETYRFSSRPTVEVVVARRPMAAGHTVGPEDIETRRVDGQYARGYAGSDSEVRGKALRYSVVAGAPIRTTGLRSVVQIRRGEKVRVQVRRGLIVVSITGEALSDAENGASIRIRNVDSKAIFDAIVTGPQEAEVRL